MKRILILTIILTMTAAIASANDGHGGGPGFGPEGGGGGAIVGSDGTAYVESHTGSGSTATTQITAINAGGTKRWTITVDNGSHPVLSGSNLIVASRTGDTTTASFKLTAINTASGATAWSLTINGIAGGIEPYNGGVYVTVVTPATTSGTAATRSLVAVSSSGSVLWTVAI